MEHWLHQQKALQRDHSRKYTDTRIFGIPVFDLGRGLQDSTWEGYAIVMSNMARLHLFVGADKCL